MIEEHFLFPQYYIHKIPKCDTCKIELWNTNVELMSNPPQRVYQCPKCNEKYNISVDDLEGEWKWRMI